MSISGIWDINEMGNTHQSSLSCLFLKGHRINIGQIFYFFKAYLTKHLERDVMGSFPIDLLFGMQEHQPLYMLRRENFKL